MLPLVFPSDENNNKNDFVISLAFVAIKLKDVSTVRFSVFVIYRFNTQEKYA